MSSAAVPVHAEIPPPSIEEVSPGIFAYIQLDGSWFLNNTAVIVGSSYATSIDSTGTEARARAWHAALRRVTDLPVNTLINTHAHGDHTYGNFVFAPAPPSSPRALPRRGPRRRPGAQPLFSMVDFGNTPLTPPFVTFEERMKLYVDGLEVQLIFVGPAHTTNDIVAWIPERKLLFTGDVIFNGGTPFALAGSIGGWLRALDVIEDLGAERLIPGHGRRWPWGHPGRPRLPPVHPGHREARHGRRHRAARARP
jgi:cyclase